MDTTTLMIPFTEYMVGEAGDGQLAVWEHFSLQWKQQIGFKTC